MKLASWQKGAGLLGLVAALGVIQAEGAQYTNNFNTDPSAELLILPSAQWVSAGGVDGSGYISITDAINDQSGAVITPDFDNGEVVSGFRAVFKLRMGGGSGNAADGFSFNWADDLPDNTMGEEGAGSGLTVTFDIYDNGGGEAPAIDVKVGGVVVASAPFAKEDILTGDQFVDVRIEYRDGLLSVDFKGETVHSGIALGLEPMAFARFGFGARTGGENNNHWIDNLGIETYLFEAPLITVVRPSGSGGVIRILDAPSSVVDEDSISATIDGTAVTGTATRDGDSVIFRYSTPELLEPGSSHTLVLTYDHGSPAQEASHTIQVEIPPYVSVPASYALDEGVIDTSARGFTWYVHQVDTGGPSLPNSALRAEEQLAGLQGENVADPDAVGPASGPAGAPNPAGAPLVFEVPGVINFNEIDSGQAGRFTPDAAFPGIPGLLGGFDNIAGEVVTAIEFPEAGVYSMIVNSDDGFRTSVGPNPRSTSALVVGRFDGGRGSADTEFDFYIPEPGFYAFSTLWYEGGGDSNLEWSALTPSGQWVLVNDTDTAPDALRAYRIPADALPAFVRLVRPPSGAGGLVAPSRVEAVLQDAGTTVNASGITLELNGEEVEVEASKSGTLTTVVYEAEGSLQTGTGYTAEIAFSTEDGPQSESWAFTTGPLATPIFVIEAEDFDYDGGFSNPQSGVEGMDVNVMPYFGGAYEGLSAYEGIDFVNSDGFDSDIYRNEIGDDGDHEVNISARDNLAGGNGAGGTYPINSSDRGTYTTTRNWGIGWVAANEWQNYTRVFPDNGRGNWWKVWAGLSYGGTGEGQLSGSLDRVISGVGTTEQETERLGQFSAPGSGGWGNNNLVPMKTASGSDAIVKLQGEETVRFNLSSGDFDFLIFSAASPPPPFVATTPLDSSKRNEVAMSWTIQNTDRTVDPDSVEVFFGGEDVTSDASVSETANGVSVELDLTGNTYDAGEYVWRIRFSDDSGETVDAQGVFVVNPYPTEGVFVIEAEDFNYSEDGVTGGLWNPQAGVEGMDVNVMPYLGGAYQGLSAVEGIDYNNNDGNDSDLYRTELDENGENEVNIGSDTGNRYSVDRGVFETTANWRIGWVAPGEWQNYTREFPEGSFQVWAAMSYDGRGAGQLNGSLDLVTSDPTQPGQSVERLGSFNAPGSGGWGRNELVPMKNDAGQIAVVQMGGVQTVRFNLGSGDFDYLLFVPTAPVSTIEITDISLTDGALTITWTGGGTLETAESLDGPWNPVPGASSPHTFTPTSDILFIRVRQ